MSKYICVNCQTEMYCEVSGVTVIEMASFGPYKVWGADLLKCPGCGAAIVGGFGEKPYRQDHYAADFPEWLERIKSRSKRVIYDYEHPQPAQHKQQLPAGIQQALNEGDGVYRP